MFDVLVEVGSQGPILTQTTPGDPIPTLSAPLADLVCDATPDVKSGLSEPAAAPLADGKDTAEELGVAVPDGVYGEDEPARPEAETVGTIRTKCPSSNRFFRRPT